MENNRDFIRAAQYMLTRLSKIYPFLPKLDMDGIFGEQTLEALMLFQREFHPPVTGKLDQGTYYALVKLWTQAERLLTDSRPLRAFPSEGYQALPGTKGSFLALPQTMFQILSGIFSGISADQTYGHHHARSVDNVRWLQHASGLKETGILDSVTWALLCRLYEIIAVWVPDHKSSPPMGTGWG